jgi:WD40 repeat protein
MTALPQPTAAANGWSLPLDECVRDLGWSRSGESIVAASATGSLFLIDAATGTVRRQLAGHPPGCLAAAWSPRAEVLASAGEDGRVTWWDARGEPLASRPGGAAWVEHLHWSPDGTLLATASGRTVRVWRAAGELVKELPEHEHTVAAVHWRADGQGLATASYGRVQLFRLTETAPYEILQWRTSHLCLAWSPTARYLAAGSQENTVTFWRLPFRDREPLQMTGYPAKVSRLARDHTGRWLATAGGDVVTVWDVSGKGPAGTRPLQLDLHPGRVTTLAFQRARVGLASGCAAGVVCLWQPGVRTDGLVAAAPRSPITALRWSPDDQLLAFGDQNGAVTLLR